MFSRLKIFKRKSIVLFSALLAGAALFPAASAAAAETQERHSPPAVFLGRPERLPGPQEVAAYRERLRLEVRAWLAQKYLGTPKPDGSAENYGQKDLEDMLYIYDLGVDYAFKNRGLMQGFNVSGYENITSNSDLLTDLLRLSANTYRYIQSYADGSSPEEKPPRPRRPVEFKSPSSVKDC